MKWGFIALFVTLAFTLVFVSSINVVTLFHGSHNIINITSSKNDIDCVPCHQWVRNELNNSTYHKWMECEDCHRYEGTGIVFASHGKSGEQAHAAYTPRCLDCHNKTSITLANGTTINITKADAFGDENYGTYYSAHRKFVEDSLNFSLSVGENEACIACHTNYSIEIDYSYFWNIEYTTLNWNLPLSSFSYSGTRNNETRWSKTGSKHEFINTTRIDCIACHKNIYGALVYGTSDTPDNYLTHAPIEISHSSSGGGGGGKKWDEYNPWGHYRYHYVPAPAANRAMWVNSSYCYECHNVKKYADENQSANSYYDLSAVVNNDTNSTQVHAAEALWCQTCHGSNKTKVVIDNPDRSGSGHSNTSSYSDFVDNIANTYARTAHGDICMGCHEAAVHPKSGGQNGQCKRCHEKGNAVVSIESEPSGLADND